ncbi:receptor-type tyrosine-protein phosphatase S-like [Dysidea avara]|uniref:receptor-type tyrosine-protein phosphatase S-like n=1 Tax=Dysidea avara TaxID=196820 RepID=UPI0033298F38
MVTRLVEDAKIKCQQYWPNDGSSVFGTIKVTLQKEEQLRSYCVRQLSITNVSSPKRETRVVHQFHFTAWPDHGVPKYGTALLEFQKRVDKHYMGKSSKPMLVHCSAGVGRTGTFIAINNEIQRIKQEGVTDIHSFVCQMRFCRNFMVQTLPQYMFIHMALLEYINCGDTSIVAPINNVQDKIDELSTLNPKKGKTGFQMQFEKLVRNSSKESDFTYVAAVSSKNKSKNRCKQFLPPESARVIVPQYDGSSDYINFCFVDGYYKSKAFLAGPGPMQSTATDFWTMVWEKKSYAIVMLGQIKENEAEASFKYWPVENKSVEFGRFLIETVSEDVWDKDIVKRTFKVTNVHQDTTRTITQLQYVEWPQDFCPNSHTPIIDLIKVLEYVQHENGNGPITVHCSNGVGRSGTFCALLICINQFKQEQMVDVFQTVQIMRSQRPGLVENMEQYEFIHRALVAAVQKHSS